MADISIITEDQFAMCNVKGIGKRRVNVLDFKRKRAFLCEAKMK